MNAFMNFMETKFVPVAAKIGAQRHLVAIRDSFAAIMALVIAGSVGVLLNWMQFTGGEQAKDPYQSFMNNLFGEIPWKDFGGNLWWSSFAIMSFFIVFLVAYNVAKSYNANAIGAGVAALGVHIMLAPKDDIWFASSATGLFVAIGVGIIVAELFRILSNSKALVIKMPEGVPPAVGKAFAALLPTLIIMSLFAVLNIIFNFGLKVNIFKVIFEVIQQPVKAMGNTLGAAIMLPLIQQTFWFFGLHGSNIIDPLMQAVYVPAVAENAAAIAAGKAAPWIVTKSFYDAFVNMGGSGTTLALIAAIFVGSKRKEYRLVAGMSAAPGAFNINESVIFGLPVVLNPILFIPFILVPVILTLVSYTVTSIGLVPATTIVIPWVAPPVLGGFLATGGSLAGAALALFNMVLAFAIYLPFVWLANKGVERQ